MKVNYATIYSCCLEKCQELGIEFDFEINVHLQSADSMDDIYKNLVFHSQNRSQGCAINFFEANSKGLNEITEGIWSIIRNHNYNLEDKYDYINLFSELKEYNYINRQITLEKGKDIQFIELAKTCQCIKKYLSQYNSKEDFVENHIFSSDAKENWKIVKKVADRIYNMSTALVPDFFKEQDYIIGKDFLIKPDIHVRRFFENICHKKMSDRAVYNFLLQLYNDADPETKQGVPPYKVDKLIFLIGVRLGNPAASKQFADGVLRRCESQN